MWGKSGHLQLLGMILGGKHCILSLFSAVCSCNMGDNIRFVMIHENSSAADVTLKCQYNSIFFFFFANGMH